VNVNIEAVQDRPEERVQMGRTPLEAAGEARWLAELQRSQELLSDETHVEMIQVVDEWLATKMDLSTDEGGPYAMMPQ
jgi:hypothetical protein